MATDVMELLRKLSTKADAGSLHLDTLDSYISGTQPLSWLAPEIAASSAGRLRSMVIGWPRLVVQAVEERLDVQGFRTDSESKPDAALWNLWQQSNMDEESQKAHLDSLIYGRAFAMVWAGPLGKARITVESPRQVYVQRYPSSNVRQYGLKRWVAEERGQAVLFTESRVYRFRTIGNVLPDAGIEVYGSGWQQVNSWPNPLGVVPIVPLVNRPRTLSPDGESELSDLLPLFDAINKLGTDLMVGGEFHSLPRRWATGIDLPEKLDEVTGLPTGEVDTERMFSRVPGRVWVAESPEAKLGEFPGADLQGFTNAMAGLTQNLGALSGLPPHYLGLHGDQPASADAIRSAEASLVSKARRKQRVFGGAWEEVMRLASAIARGSYDGSLNNLETVWADPETRTVAQAMDAAAKAVASGILHPDFAAEFYLGLTPTQIDRNRSLRRRGAIDTAATRLLEQ